MASLDRAYGARGAVIALGMACVAGGVQGVMAWSFDILAVKIAVGLAGAIVLVMAGAISARRSSPGAIGLGLLMGAFFFISRWIGWTLMDGGVSGAAAFVAALPWGWPGYLAAAGISGFWVFEGVSMLAPALFGCIVGQERPD